MDTAAGTTMDVESSSSSSSSSFMSAYAGGESMPWVEKYRPKELDQLVSHEQIIQTRASLAATRFIAMMRR